MVLRNKVWLLLIRLIITNLQRMPSRKETILLHLWLILQLYGEYHLGTFIQIGKNRHPQFVVTGHNLSKSLGQSREPRFLGVLVTQNGVCSNVPRDQHAPAVLGVKSKVERALRRYGCPIAT